MSDAIEPVYKKIDISIFEPGEIITDRVGNVFLRRETVAQVLGVSLVALRTTYKRKGLFPVDHYVRGYKPYLLEDVERAYNKRAR